MNMKLKKLLNDIQKTEDKIAELQEHLNPVYCGKIAYGRRTREKVKRYKK